MEIKDQETIDIAKKDPNSELSIADADNDAPSEKVEVEEKKEEGPFEALGVGSEILEALDKIGWSKPTPIQVMCLPESLNGKDVAGFAQTGTGKTGVFLITAAHNVLRNRKKSGKSKETKAPSAIVLAPTRELAIQIDNDCKGLFPLLDISSVAVYGGADYEKQEAILKNGVDIVIATPGRLKDFFEKEVVILNQCGLFVCDEADRMFDMGFIDDVEFFLDKLPDVCQKLLFSATSNDHVKELAFEYLEKPNYLYANPETITPEKINQEAYICESKNKLKVLLGMLEEYKPACSVIFVNTKLVAEWLHFKLENNDVSADLITGDLPQKKRIALISKIKRGEVKALIATDVASRGLHIASLTHVFNFDLPDDPANYVHRIGRTARAGSAGTAISFVCEDYGQNLAAINKLLGDDFDLTSKWHEDRYLEIKDKAPNPYKSGKPFDRNDRDQKRDFRGDSSRDRGRDRDRDRDRGDRDNSRGRDRDRDRDQNKPRRDNKPQPRNRSNNQNDFRSKRPNDSGNRPRNQSKTQNRKKYNQPNKSVNQQQESSSLFGMLKKAVRTVLGKK